MGTKEKVGRQKKEEWTIANTLKIENETINLRSCAERAGACAILFFAAGSAQAIT